MATKKDREAFQLEGLNPNQLSWYKEMRLIGACHEDALLAAQLNGMSISFGFAKEAK